MNITAENHVAFTLNGERVAAPADAGERLSQFLRERIGAREVKIGCNAGDCGACTVLLDGEPVCACLVPAQQAQGRSVDTVKALSGDPLGLALMERFESHQAAQCGICTPGMLVSAVALLRENPQPQESEVQDALGGVLCRCTGYRKIIDAVVAAGSAPAHLDGSAPLGGPIGAVGDPVRRIDGRAKVMGDERFGDDVGPTDALIVKLVRSPFAHARFEFGDIDGWRRDNPGVEAVLTVRDVPGKNIFGVIPGFLDQPVFAEKETLFRGDPVAAVVGDAHAMARFEPAGFPVTWTELPAVLLPPQALAPDAPQLHANRPGNLMCTGFVKSGDSTSALARADVVVEGGFETGFVEHAYIEPEAGFAQMRDGRLEIHACTQAPVMDLDTMVEIMAMDRKDICIVPTAVGGGFGSKLDVSVQPYLGLAAWKTGKPVRMAYSRTESMQATTKRHPASIRLRLGATQDGKLCGMEFDGDFNTGAYSSWGPTVATRVPIHASGPYRIGDYTARSRGVYTNCAPSGAFRGFGVPQSALAQETTLDALAEKLAIDPLEFRIMNALENGVPTVCGQVFAQGVGIKACLEALRPAWAAAKAGCASFNAANGVMKRGVGVAAGWYGCGNTSMPNPSTIKSGLRQDGTIMLHQGAVDIGQGSNTVIAQIFAQALGVPFGAVRLAQASTDNTPDAGKTSASRQTFVTGNAARLCGLSLRAQILRHCNAAEDAVITLSGGKIVVADAAGMHVLEPARMEADGEGYVLVSVESYDPPTKPLDANGQGEPYAQFGYAAHLAIVEVDTRLGNVRPLQFVAAHDVGKAVNPLLVEGQVQGGIAQGLGMALMEEFIPHRTENLHDYLIPTIGDVPPVETIIVEVPDAHGPFGAKGLGEHVLIPTAPAIINAIRNATGVALRQVPATPARVRAALKEAGHE